MTSAGRALRARVRLRNVLKREPSVSEVRDGLEISCSKNKPKWQELRTAFEKGEEVRPEHTISPFVAKNSDVLQKMQVIGIQCKRYDSFLAGNLLEN